MLGNHFIYRRIRNQIIFVAITSLVYPLTLTAATVASEALSNNSNRLSPDSLLSLANENVRTAKQDYETGRGDFLSLIFAKKNCSTTQSAQLHILTEYYQHGAQLNRVIGDTLETKHVTPSSKHIISSIYEMGGYSS